MAAQALGSSAAALGLQEIPETETEETVESESSEEGLGSSRPKENTTPASVSESTTAPEDAAASEHDSIPETASDAESGSASSEPAVSSGDAGGSVRVPVSSGDAATPGISAPEKPTVSDGDVVRPVRDTAVNTNSASVDHSGLEDLFADLQETETAQLESLIRIEAQNEAVISILLIILVVGLLHYIYRFLKMFV